MSWNSHAGSVLGGHCEESPDNIQTSTASPTPTSGPTISRPAAEQQNTLILHDSNDKSQEPLRKRRTYKSRAPRKTETISGKPQTWNADGPLYLRQSDNQLVHLHCCVIGCRKAYFTTITSLMQHVSSPKHHGFGRGFFKNHSDAVEKCGRLPGENDNERFLQIQPKEMGTYGTYTPEVSTANLVSTSAPEKSVFTESSSGQLRILGRRVFGEVYEQENDFPTSERRVSRISGTENELAYSTGIGLFTLGHELQMDHTLLANENAASELSANQDSIPTTIASENLHSIDEQNPTVNRESSVEYRSNGLSPGTHDFEAIARSHSFGQEITIKSEQIDDHLRTTTSDQLAAHDKAFSDIHASRNDPSSNAATSAADNDNPLSDNIQKIEHNDLVKCKRALSHPLESSEKRTQRHSTVYRNFFRQCH